MAEDEQSEEEDGTDEDDDGYDVTLDSEAKGGCGGSCTVPEEER